MIQPLVDQLKVCLKHYEKIGKLCSEEGLEAVADQLKNINEVNAAIIGRLDMRHIRELPF